MLQVVTNNKPNGMVIPPTMNSLRHHREYLTRMTMLLEQYIAHNRTAPSKDILVIHETVVRAAYLIILFDGLLERYGDELPEHFDFADDMEKVIHLSINDVNARTATDKISIANYSEVNTTLQDMIDRYFYIPVKRSFWRSLLGG